jgi:hypothetical protein
MISKLPGKIRPAGKRRRSESIRCAIRDAIRRRHYEQIRAAYLRQPDSAADADDWSNTEDWKP